MAVWLKQSTSVDVPVGPFLDETDGKTAETGLTITQPDVRLKKNAGNWAQKNAAQTLTHEENGWYELTLDDTDTNTLGVLIVAIHESGALPVWREFHVVSANVYDSIIGGSDTLNADVTQFGGTNGTFSGGRPEVNTTHAAGTAWGSGAITAASIAADAIGASELAADAVAEIADAVWDELQSGHVAAGSFGEIATEIADILVDTAVIGAAGAGLSAIPWNAAWDAEVQSEVEDGLVTHRLDELLNADSDIDGAAPPTVGSVFHELMSKTAGSFTFDQTTDALEAVRDKLTDIETDTAEIGAAGAGLTNINLPDQTMNITGNITGNLSGSVGSVTGAVGSVTGAVGSVTGAVGSVAAGGITAASIATDAIDADALADNAITAATFAAGAINAAAIATDAIDADAVASDLDTYQAKIWLVDDDNGTTDRWVVCWYKNAEPVVSGITSPTIQVIKIADGTDLVASTAMTEIGALGLYRYTEATNRIVDGVGYIAKAAATIGGSGRTWYQPMSRDST